RISGLYFHKPNTNDLLKREQRGIQIASGLWRKLSTKSDGHNMPIIDLIGKILYPRRQPWERRHKLEVYIIIVIITLIAFALCALIIILED
ncbi:MAG: hypothetical protein ABR955_10280, partial [Verrucomicrobiota bacterium]